jgi:hypothetical protein
VGQFVTSMICVCSVASERKSVRMKNNLVLVVECV